MLSSVTQIRRITMKLGTVVLNYCVAQQVGHLADSVLPLQREVRSRIQRVRGEDWAAHRPPCSADGSAAYFLSLKNINLTFLSGRILDKTIVHIMAQEARN